MQISVKTQYGNTITLTCGRYMTIASLKNHIQFLEAIPASMQSILFAGATLKDNCSLLDYGICDGHLLLLKGKRVPDIQIFVQIFVTGLLQAFTLEVGPTDTTTLVKSQIWMATGIAAQRQCLINFEGCQLEDGVGIDMYGITDGDSILCYVDFE